MIPPILKSARFWTLLATGLVVVLRDKTPFTDEQIMQFVMAIGSWVLGESLRASNEPGATFKEKLFAILGSRRFKVSVLNVLLAFLGEMLSLTPDQITALSTTLSAWVLGESVRKTNLPPSK